MAGLVIEQRQALATPAVKRITDFDDLVQLFTQWEGRFEQLSCGRFEGTLLVAGSRHILAHLATANQSMRIQGREGAGICSFSLVVPASVGSVWQHRRIEPGRLVARSGEVEVDHRTSKQACSLSYSVTEEGLRQATRAFNRTDPGRIGWLALNPPPAVFAALEQRIRRFIVALAQPSSTGPQDARVLEQECLLATVEALYPQAASPTRLDLPLPVRGKLAGRAEELMRARLQIPTGEIDLCTELGVSGRTLRLAFRERFALGPMAYFQTLRLNAARNVLKTADPEAVAVAQVAGQFGFSHLGKFAGYYRRLFGERPSDTLTK